MSVDFLENQSARQIFLPPIKTVGSTIRLYGTFYLLNYVLLMCTPTTALDINIQ